MKLFSSTPGHFLAFCPQITAEACGVTLETIVVPEDLAKSDEFISKKMHWNFPVLETADGHIISQSCANAAFIARSAGRLDFIGTTAFE